MSSTTPTNASSETSPKVAAVEVPAGTTSTYPTAELRASVLGRNKRVLGDIFGLSNFGINHTTLEPGAGSALAHYHTHQDEFVYILEGIATCKLINDDDDGTADDDQQEWVELKPGDCIGFPKGRTVGHCIQNLSSTDRVVYLEIGDRTPGDVVEYPGTDLKCTEDDEGNRKFLHKDGSPYTTAETDA